MVLDIQAYDQFIPWCVGSRVVSNENGCIIADLVAEFKIFTSKYRSKVIFGQNEINNYFINSEAIDSQFEYLTSNWLFIPDENKENSENPHNKTKIIFNLSFKFKSNMLNDIADGLFVKATNKMIEAFEQRAQELYGN